MRNAFKNAYRIFKSYSWAVIRFPDVVSGYMR